MKMIPLKALCLKHGIDPCRARERAKKNGIPLKLVKHPGNNGRHFKMLCFAEVLEQTVLQAIKVKRGPYKTKRR